MSIPKDDSLEPIAEIEPVFKESVTPTAKRILNSTEVLNRIKKLEAQSPDSKIDALQRLVETHNNQVRAAERQIADLNQANNLQATRINDCEAATADLNRSVSLRLGALMDSLSAVETAGIGYDQKAEAFQELDFAQLRARVENLEISANAIAELKALAREFDDTLVRVVHRVNKIEQTDDSIDSLRNRVVGLEAWRHSGLDSSAIDLQQVIKFANRLESRINQLEKAKQYGSHFESKRSPYESIEPTPIIDGTIINPDDYIQIPVKTFLELIKRKG